MSTKIRASSRALPRRRPADRSARTRRDGERRRQPGLCRRRERRRPVHERLRRALQPGHCAGQRLRLDGPVRIRRLDVLAGNRLTGTIQPGRAYLVQLASAAAVGASLPPADATGTTNLAASGGKIALVAPTPTRSRAARRPAAARRVRSSRTSSATARRRLRGRCCGAALSNTTAAIRGGGGCADTNANAADFTTGAPAPKNSSAPAAPCSGTATSSTTGSAAVDLDLQPLLSLALERSTISFGRAFAGDTPAAISERITVVSNGAAGYSLTAHRTAFAPARPAARDRGASDRSAHADPRRVRARSRPGVDHRSEPGSRRRLADEHRLRMSRSGPQSRPLHGDAHVHRDRTMIALPPIALSASPARVAIAPRQAQEIHVTNAGRAPAVVVVVGAGYALAPRGRPRVVARKHPGWLRFRPERLLLAPGRPAPSA